MTSIVEHPQAVHIFDDFLLPPFEGNELKRIASLRTKKDVNRYFWHDLKTAAPISLEISRLYQRVLKAVTITEEAKLVGFEYWANELGPRDSLAIHSDVDEYLYVKHRQLRCAQIGVIYFGACTDLRGGELVFEDGIIVSPRSNRCVVFFGATRHGVERISNGSRSTVVMSIWDHATQAAEEGITLEDAGCAS